MTKWAVVTGAAHGIGAVIAEHAVKEGYRVAAWDIDGPAVERTARAIGDACVGVTVDVADEDAVRAAAARLPEPPQLVVNNAGIVRFGPLFDLPVTEWDAALRVNLTGTFIVARTLAAAMARAGGGAIVNLASINGLAAAPHAGAYSASKAGVVRLTEHMALEWARHDIRVNCVAPGLIHAGMSDPIYADPEVRRVREGAVPLARLGSAEDVAAAVLFLGSAKSAYVTGQTLAVDGGLSKSTLAALPRPASVDSVGFAEG